MECIADFHAGLKVHSLNRLENGFLFPSAEGAVGALFPVSEPIYRRSLALQGKLAQDMPYRGGHNPVDYRTCLNKSDRDRPKKRVIDRAVLLNYLYLP